MIYSMVLRTPLFLGIGVIVGTILTWILYRSLEKRYAKGGAFAAGLLAFYVLVVLWITVFGRQESERRVYLVLFRLLRDPVTKPKTFLMGLRYVICNIYLFVPAGFLAALYRRGKKSRLLLTAAGGFLLSLCIEILQFAMSRGYFELDDLIVNTLGAAAGFLLLCLYEKVKSVYHKAG